MGISAVVAMVAEAAATVGATVAAVGAEIGAAVSAAAAGVTASMAIPEVAAAAAEWGGAEIAGGLGASFLPEAGAVLAEGATTGIAGAAMDAGADAAASAVTDAAGNVVDDFAANGMGSQLATDAPATGSGLIDKAAGKAVDFAENKAVSTMANGMLAPDAPTATNGSNPNAYSSFKNANAPAVPPATSQQFADQYQQANGFTTPPNNTGLVNSITNSGSTIAPDGSNLNPMQNWGPSDAVTTGDGTTSGWLSSLGTKAADFLKTDGGGRIATGIVGGVIQGVGQGMAANQKHQWEMDALDRARRNLSAPVVIAGPRP